MKKIWRIVRSVHATLPGSVMYVFSLYPRKILLEFHYRALHLSPLRLLLDNAIPITPDL